MRPVFLSATLSLCMMSAAHSESAPSLQLLQHALDPNPMLQTYTASATLAVILHGPIPVRKTLHGTVYYHKPTRRVVFSNVPPALRSFSELAASMPAYDQVVREYSITPDSDDGKSSTYVLLPNRRGRVVALNVRVGDESELIEELLWTYVSNETLSVHPTYAKSDDLELLSSAAISAHFTGYNVDGTIGFSDYKLEVPVTI